MFYFTETGAIVNTDHIVAARVKVTKTKTHAIGTIEAWVNWDGNPQDIVLETVKSALRGAVIPVTFTRKCDARLKELAALFNGEGAR